MHHITIRDQVCNVMASLTKTFLSVPRLSCKTLKRSLLADHRSCYMPFSMVGSTGTVLQNDESAPCKRNRILPQFLTVEPHFVRKGPPETRNRNFTSVFGDRTSFRAKGLRRTT